MNTSSLDFYMVATAYCPHCRDYVSIFEEIAYDQDALINMQIMLLEKRRAGAPDLDIKITCPQCNGEFTIDELNEEA